MKPGDQKPFVPVFVGSTFEDMKEYRQAVQQTLVNLETIVRGMEYFGSRPGTPVEECLAAVRSCRVYIGLFGMRYGFIPEQSEYSMTHLEYLEAQKQEIPSLVYLIDEENQPILPKFIEKGAGSDKLIALKSELRRRHVVSIFTTPQDLASKVRIDLPRVLQGIGTEVKEDLVLDGATQANAILKKSRILPKSVAGREIVVSIELGGLSAVDANECNALRLPLGYTVRSYCKVNGNNNFYVYAANKIADEIIELNEKDVIQASATVVYGTTKELQWGEDGPVEQIEEHIGLNIKDVLSKKR